MLNTWEGAVRFCEAAASQSKPSDIADLLGWRHPHGSSRGMQMSTTAAACELVRDGHLSRSDLHGLSVHYRRAESDVSVQSSATGGAAVSPLVAIV